MRIVMLSVIGAVLLVPSPSSEPGPSERGYIILDSNCNVSATDVVVRPPSGPGNVPVKWTIISDGCAEATVAVGIYKRKEDGEYYPLLDCHPPGVTVKDGERKPYTCTLNRACPGDEEDYEYDVCVNGEPVWDPELRIRGGGKLGDLRSCPGEPDKAQVEQDCIDASTPSSE
jgi:hypothetical protein